jgi:hypothetical protein
LILNLNVYYRADGQLSQHAFANAIDLPMLFLPTAERLTLCTAGVLLGVTWQQPKKRKKRLRAIPPRFLRRKPTRKAP